MKIIGVTGGIGSGKSIVCQVFQTLGVPVFNADDAAKTVYDDFPEVLEAVRKEFGATMIHEGKLNRTALAALVFENAEALKKLNALVHPKVREKFHRWMEQQRAPYVIREAAILIESHSYLDCDRVVLVSAPEELRISRVMKRSALTAEEIRQRMSRQMTDPERRRYAHHELVNDDHHLVVPDILAIHYEMLEAVR